MSIAPHTIKPNRANWRGALLVCRKCQKKLHNEGFGPDGDERLSKALKRAVGTKPYTRKVRELVGELAATLGEDVDHPLNGHQHERFMQAAAALPGVRRSLANSAGVLLGPDFALDEVRPGITLYGGGPRGAPDPRFRAVATLSAPVLQLRTVRPGESVGYGADFTAGETLRTATVAAGARIVFQGHRRNACATHATPRNCTKIKVWYGFCSPVTTATASARIIRRRFLNKPRLLNAKQITAQHNGTCQQ